MRKKLDLKLNTIFISIVFLLIVGVWVYIFPTIIEEVMQPKDWITPGQSIAVVLPLLFSLVIVLCWAFIILLFGLFSSYKRGKRIIDVCGNIAVCSLPGAIGLYYAGGSLVIAANSLGWENALEIVVGGLTVITLGCWIYSQRSKVKEKRPWKYYWVICASGLNLVFLTIATAYFLADQISFIL